MQDGYKMADAITLSIVINTTMIEHTVLFEKITVILTHQEFKVSNKVYEEQGYVTERNLYLRQCKSIY